jgi:hypothetical protein
MRLVSPVPAFGFEIASYYGKDYYTKAYEKAKTVDLVEVADNLEALNWVKSAYRVTNFVKFLGYIPLIGTFVGINRILAARKASRNEMPNKNDHILRGGIEAFSVGILLLIPDLILTLIRYLRGSKNSLVCSSRNSVIS